jgi:multisubunit Na+/H+ antiporter MnhC subunit
MILYSLALTLFALGVYGLLAKKNLLKIFFSISFMELGVILLFVISGYSRDVFSGVSQFSPLSESMALCLLMTSLVFTIVLAALIVRLKENYGTFDTAAMRKLKG